MQVLARVVNETPAAPSQVVPGLPEGVDRVIARAMAKEPDRRYPSGEDMAADIEAVLASRPLAPADDLPALQLEDEPLAAMLEEPAAAKTTPSRAAPTPAPAPAAASGTAVGLTMGTAARTGAVPAAPLAEPIPAPARGRRPGGGSWTRRPALWVSLGAAALLLVGLAAMRPSRAPERRTVAEATARPAAREPEPTPEPEPMADGEGRLEIDFEHHLRSGRLQVWVDDDPVLDEALDSRVTKQILSLRLRKGALQQVLPIPAGRHEVRVRLQWSDKVRSRRIAANFEEGQTRTLRVRVSRIFNDLSLDWE